MESQETISPSSRLASSTASPVFPEAVGPTTQTMRSMQNLPSIKEWAGRALYTLLNCFSSCRFVSVMQMGRPCGQYLSSSRESTSRTSASRSGGSVW
jgi:hypothetical protein